MSEEKKEETVLVSLPALEHLKKKVQNPDTLINLIVQPGSRVRAFDDLKGTTGDVFPDNTEAGKFVRNAKDALAMFSPPYTQAKTSEVFKQLAKLDNDIMNTEDFKEILKAVNKAVDELPLEGPKSVKSAIEEMHLKDFDMPQTPEQLRKFLKDAVEKDLRSAYRFKTLSSTDYYDTPAANGRVKDFAQGYNTSYRNDPDNQALCLERLLDKATKELGDRVQQLSVSTDGKSLASIESAVKDLISHKAFDRIGIEGAIAIISKGLEDPKYKDVANKEEFIATVRNFYQLKIELDKTTQPKEGEDEKVDNTNRPGIEGLNEVLNSEAYKSIQDKSIANAILLEHVATLSSSTFRDELEFEISKHALIQVIDTELAKRDEGGKSQDAQTIIGSIYANKAYQTLGENAGAEVLMTKINGVTDPTLKAALIADFDRRFDNAIKRELDDKVTAANASDQMEKLLGDKHFPLIDQHKAQERILSHIANIENKETKKALLNALNQQTNNQYAFPKSAMAKFFDKAVDWIKDVPNKMSKLGSKIKNFFNPPSKIHGNTSITTHPDAGISSPTMSEETKAEITKRHKTIPISELKEKQEEMKDAQKEMPTPLNEEDIKAQEKAHGLMGVQDKINRQASEAALNKITTKCALLAQSIKNSTLPHKDTFRNDFIITLTQLDQLRHKVNQDFVEGKISKQTNQSLISKINSMEMKTLQIEVVYNNLKKQGKPEEAKQDTIHELDGGKPTPTSRIDGSQPQITTTNKGATVSSTPLSPDESKSSEISFKK